MSVHLTEKKHFCQPVKGSMLSKQPGALSHIRVLDLTRVRAGPTCCRILADFGADVVKIEAPPGLDPNAGIGGSRLGYDMQNLHRSKRSLSLNLKSSVGRDLLLRLVETADIVVENFRPDVKDRLGIGYGDLRKVNKRIILASISGFGQTGPYRDRPGFDQIAQGMGGLMSITGVPGEGPMRAGIAIADSGAGIFGAVGILIALAERERSGEGQWVQTSLLEAQISLLDFQAAAYLVDRKIPKQAGNDHPYSTPMGVLKTSDGFINIGVAGEGQWQSFCKCIGEPELAAHPDYETQDMRYKNRPALMRRLVEIFGRKSSSDWIRDLLAAGVPAGPIYAINEMFDDPQVQHLGIAAKLDHPKLGKIELVGQPVQLSRTPAQITSPAPEAGEHTAEILAEIGIDSRRLVQLRSENVV
jgi:crotonobetainyl-CoA:carnitine CoA-transferase CaiB-like acyl-CoA transferase